VSAEKIRCRSRRVYLAALQAVAFDCVGGVFRRNSLDPCFFPKEQTPGLTVAMSRSVASQFTQMNSVLQAPRFSVSACVIGVFNYWETIAAKREHLGHERNTFEFALIVQSCQDLISRPHLDDLANSRSSPKLPKRVGVTEFCGGLERKIAVDDLPCHCKFVLIVNLPLRNVAFWSSIGLPLAHTPGAL